MLLATVTTDPQERFIRIQCSPRATVNDWRASLEAFMALAMETGIRRGLVDVRSQESESGPQMELFDFGSKLPPDMVFAVMSDARNHDHVFVETVALNRGKNVRLFFGAEEEAIEWLMAQSV